MLTTEFYKEAEVWDAPANLLPRLSQVASWEAPSATVPESQKIGFVVISKLD